MNGEPGEWQLQPLELWFQPGTGPLLPQVQAVLGRQARRSAADAAAGFAEPLRWAITAVDPERGLRLEAVMLIGPVVQPG